MDALDAVSESLSEENGILLSDQHIEQLMDHSGQLELEAAKQDLHPEEFIQVVGPYYNHVKTSERMIAEKTASIEGELPEAVVQAANGFRTEAAEMAFVKAKEKIDAITRLREEALIKPQELPADFDIRKISTEELMSMAGGVYTQQNESGETTVISVGVPATFNSFDRSRDGALDSARIQLAEYVAQEQGMSKIIVNDVETNSVSKIFSGTIQNGRIVREEYDKTEDQKNETIAVAQYKMPERE